MTDANVIHVEIIPKDTCYEIIELDVACAETAISAEREQAKGLVRLFLSWNDGNPAGNYLPFSIDEKLGYSSFCDDFGPLDILSVLHFVELLDAQLQTCIIEGTEQLVYRVTSGRRAFTNAMFLLGAYMILKLHKSADEVQKHFADVQPCLIEGYRDATYSVADFRLQLIDCWQGLDRGKALGWIALPTDDSGFCGMMDKDQYAHYCDALNADLNEVVPHKFIAFRGPKDLGDMTFRDDPANFVREFDPKHYVDLFADYNVSTVIRLNHAEYSGSVFEAAGIRHHDLVFEDCTAPPPSVVQRFFEVVDDAPGAVAVHCKAGLGRTGTLIALYMMRSHGFSAREAMGWLRIMRPGCVIGVQQHFLVQVDSSMRDLAAAGRLPRDPAAAACWASRGRSTLRRSMSMLLDAELEQSASREEGLGGARDGGLGFARTQSVQTLGSNPAGVLAAVRELALPPCNGKAVALGEFAGRVKSEEDGCLAQRYDRRLLQPAGWASMPAARMAAATPAGPFQGVDAIGARRGHGKRLDNPGEEECGAGLERGGVAKARELAEQVAEGVSRRDGQKAAWRMGFRRWASQPVMATTCPEDL